MKSVLIITEQFTIGGLETHIQSEILYFVKNGYKVHLAVGTQFSDVLLPQGVASVCRDLNISAAINSNQLIELVDDIRKIIQEKSIDLIHAHPFNSLIPSFLAAEEEGISLIITLHGPASLSGYSGPFYDFLLKSIILPNASSVVCVSDEVQSMAAPYVNAERLSVVPNGVGFSKRNRLESDCSTQDLRWCLVSRLDSQKINGIFDFAVKASSAGIPGLLIVGDGPAKDDLQNRLNNAGLQAFVDFYGSSVRVQALMRQYAGVAGMGRVALEGIAAQKTVALVGYDGLKGIITPHLLEKARASNFSGRNLKNIDADTFHQQLQEISEDSIDSLRDIARINFDQDVVWERFIAVSRGLSPIRKNILSEAVRVLRITGVREDVSVFESQALISAIDDLSCSPGYFSPSIIASFGRCKVGVEEIKKRREEMMESGIADVNKQDTKLESGSDDALCASSKGLNQNTWDLEAVISDLKIEAHRLHEILQEKEKKLEELELKVSSREEENSEFEEKIALLDKEIATLRDSQASLARDISIESGRVHAMLNSKSWRLTRPLRLCADVYGNKNKYIYQIARATFFALPEFVRKMIERPAYEISKYSRDKILLENKVEKDCDLSWDRFSEEVLSKRKQYKGIFIQEVVIDWNVPLYQRPQHMAVALARLGYLVIYRTDNWTADDVNGFREVENNVWVSNRDEVDLIDDVIRSVYSTAYSNSAERLLKKGARGTLIYEYIDHIDPEISGDDENIKRLLSLKNFAFTGGADYVVASAQKLYEEAVQAVGEEKVIFVPNGVDTIHYRSESHRSFVLPDALLEFRGKYKKIVGYFGALAPWLWYDVIKELISQRTDVGFVFIGPDYYGGADCLPELENVLYMGSIDYKVLPAYARMFDVCFIPFKPGEIARTTSPLKLFEYFALEKPVVVTSEMLECVRYPEVFRGDSVESLSKAIDDALLTKDDKSYKSRLSVLADDNNWSKRASALLLAIKSEKKE